MNRLNVISLADLDFSTTNSVVNALMADQKAPAPEVGMGATELMWTDRKAYTILSVEKNTRGVVVSAKMQADRSRRTDDNGMSDCQSYSYEADAAGKVVTIKRTRDGRWRVADPRTGRVNSASAIVRVGVRDAYYDFSF